MANSGIFGVAHISAGSLECSRHLARFLNRHCIVLHSMKNPHRRLSDAARSLGVGISNLGIIHQAYMQLRKPLGTVNSTTDWNQGGEPARIFCRELPCAVPAHRDSSQINAITIPFELLNSVIQSSERLRMHASIDPSPAGTTL